jgi:hypothetical protein
MTNFTPYGKETGFRKNTFSVSFCLISVLFILALASSGCSMKKIAINRLGDALARGGTTFSSDNDPELIRDAAPFSLKLMESILAESPQHAGLLLALSSGFTQYAFAFVVQEAEETEENDLARAMEARTRALRLYLRARDYGLRALDGRHPGFTDALNDDPEKAVQTFEKKDVPFAYWTAV